MSALSEKTARWFLPAFMLIASVTLLVLGVPRLLHELMLVPGTPILYRVNAGEDVSDQDLSILENSRLDALVYIETSEVYNDLASSYLTRARRAATLEERQNFAELTIETSRKSLSIAPLNTYAWSRIATANVLLGQSHYGDALTAWRTSISQARYEPFLQFQRIHLGTILYRTMTPEDIISLKEQLDMAYQSNKYGLRHYVRDNNLMAWMEFLVGTESEMLTFLRQPV